MKCKCFICKTEGEIEESTDLICRPCYGALKASRDKLKTALKKISDIEDEHFETGCGYSGMIDKIAKQALIEVKV